MGRWCDHPGDPVTIGGKEVYLGARPDLDPDVVETATVILPLNGELPRKLTYGRLLPVIYCELTDRGGVPEKWEWFIHEMARLLKANHKILAYCTGGHGRTGTFGASLIAVMEPETEDPIAAIRERHCEKAVESLAQARAIFALRGQSLPEVYEEEFKPTPVKIFSAKDSDTGRSLVELTDEEFKQYLAEKYGPETSIDI